MRELRALTERLRSAFEAAGYGEVWTPSLEYEEVLKTGDERAAGAGYRLFDEHGEGAVAMRSDTSPIPIARVVASRYADAEPPPLLLLRACVPGGRARRGPAARVPPGRGGGDRGAGARGEAEVIALCISALEEAGLRRHRLGVGDGQALPAPAEGFDVPEERLGLLEALSRRDLAGLEMRVSRLGLPASERDLLVRLPQAPWRSRRPGARGPVESLRGLHALLEERGVADRVIFDLGLVREAGLLHGRRLRLLRPGGGLRSRGRRPLRRADRQVRPAAAGVRNRARRAEGAYRSGCRGGVGVKVLRR